MHEPTRSPQSRPHSAPAYYLALPASVWITVLQHPRSGAISPQGCTPGVGPGNGKETH